MSAKQITKKGKGKVRTKAKNREPIVRGRRRLSVIGAELLLHLVKIGIGFPEDPDSQDVVLAAGGQQTAAMTEFHGPNGAAVADATATAAAVTVVTDIAEGLNLEEVGEMEMGGFVPGLNAHLNPDKNGEKKRNTMNRYRISMIVLEVKKVVAVEGGL